MERILLIGLSGLDWPSLGKAMARGWAPALSALARRGASGPLRATPPLTGPAPWASLATGHLPERHGVFAEDEAWAGGIRPASRASWRAVPVWDMIAAGGVPVASVGWPASRPGAAWLGRHVDDAYAIPNGESWDEWAMPLDCTPPDLREALRTVRVHPADIDGAMLAPLVPDLAAVDQGSDATLAHLAVAMAEAATVQAAAMRLAGEAAASEAKGALCLVHHRWMAQVIAHVGSDPRAPYADVIAGAWRFLDGMVGALIDQAGQDDLVLVIAPGRASNAGVLLAAGPGVGASSTILGARLIDLAPTLLSRFGLRDPRMAGRPIAALARDAVHVVPIDAADSAASTGTALMSAVMAQGYAAPPPPASAWRAARLVEYGEMLLARAPEQALAAADEVLALMADHPAALGLRAFALVALQRPDALADVAERLGRAAPDRAWGALAQGAYHALRGEARQARAPLLAAEAADEAVTRLRAGAAWLVLRRAADATRAFTGALALDPGNADAELGLSMAAALQRRWLEAEAPLRRVLAADPAHVAAWTKLHEVLRQQGRRAEAKEAMAMLVRLGAIAAQTVRVSGSGKVSKPGRANQ